MCGIAGIVGSGADDLVTRMRAMRDRLVHRGPDSGGEHVDARAALGIRRLRIIDLATGDQPISNEDGRVWTVFNGEIYNYRELRDELVARGHTLRTRSDTEVIPHLYEDHGPAFVERLTGMFALAVWDERDGTLVLARDRLGKKPLLYSSAPSVLTFASEHDALLAGLRAMPPADPVAIRAYLRLGYVPAPHDAFAGVRKIPPAHYLVWRDGRSELVRYWSLPTAVETIDEAEAIAEFRRLFEQAVRRRLVSDVPLGALLSGGVDSSAVVATMAALSTRVRTFSIGFEEASFSELAHARRVAERFATEHHELVVRPDA
ncbi:MAG: asparagine synthase (glutamine-hydrolyzing), partial [Elusimicrobia bacterium]|nr:asparagine synthase (glutamine-hydrolyzing) [Elusimicrobiota bacterium]